MGMDIKNDNTISIQGKIDNLHLFHDLANKMDTLIEKKPEYIQVEFSDCNEFHSSMIGYFMKVSRQDKIPLKLHTDNAKLDRLISSLQLDGHITVHLNR